jgi:hypothetical protein
MKSLNSEPDVVDNWLLNIKKPYFNNNNNKKRIN